MWDIWILIIRWIHVIIVIVIMWIHIFRWNHVQSDEFMSLCEFIQSDEFTLLYKNSCIIWIHALLAQFPICGCAYFSSLLAQWRWQNSLVHLWTFTDAPWGTQGKFVCSFPVLLTAPLFDGGRCCQGSWIAASNVAWIHVATWMQASLQHKANKSVVHLRWKTWRLLWIVLGSLFLWRTKIVSLILNFFGVLDRSTSIHFIGLRKI